MMSVSVFQVLIRIITGIPCPNGPKSVPKPLFWINRHNIQAEMLHSEYILSILLLKW